MDKFTWGNYRLEARTFKLNKKFNKLLDEENIIEYYFDKYIWAH